MRQAIDYFAYDNKLISVKTFFSIIARKKMFMLFNKHICPKKTDEVLDLGATPDIELADSNLFDRLYPYKSKITVCSIEDCSDLVKDLGLKAFHFNEAKKSFHLMIMNLIYASALLCLNMSEIGRIRSFL